MSAIRGLSKEQIIALLTKEPLPARPGNPELVDYRNRPPRLLWAEYEAWVDRLSRQKPEDTE